MFNDFRFSMFLVLFLTGFFLTHEVAAQVVDPCSFGCPKVGCAQCDKEKPIECRKGMCLKYEEECVPGCDPPDEKNTVRGCSPCYSKVKVCVSWEEICR